MSSVAISVTAPSDSSAAPIDGAAIQAFVALIGLSRWTERIDVIRQSAASGPRSGRAILQRHAVELAIDRLCRRQNRPPTPGELRIASLAHRWAAVAETLNHAGRAALRTRLRAAIESGESLIGAFHLLRIADMQQSRGFQVGFAGLEEGAPFDLMLARDGVEAELVADLVSAESGRGVHRGAWFRLADRIDPDLQVWLAAHPGRYLLKMMLPAGLQSASDDANGLAAVHDRVRAMLQTKRRSDQDAAVVLRLDPLLLAGAQAGETGLMSSLRHEFGPEAHLSVTTAGQAVFVMAARAARENDVAVAIRRHMAMIAPSRLTGSRPGILAMLVEDTDRAEWRGLRDSLELEGETRQFLNLPEARSVVAVSCASRLELFGAPEPDAAPGGELRFRNPSHPAARLGALAPAILSSM